MESRELREEEEVVEKSGGSIWSASTTRMLISYYSQNPILWDKQLKENGNKTKKKAMVPFIARFEKTNPPRFAQDLKAIMAQFEELSVVILEKAEGGRGY